MMEGSDKKKTETDSFTDIVFSWSIEDIYNDDLYKNKVEKVNPESFPSVQHYFGSYAYPLLDETRAQLQSSMQAMDRAPFGEVIVIEESEPYGTQLYDIQVDFWRNMSSDCSKEPYKTLPGDVFVLADAKPETAPDLQKLGRSWAFAIVTEVSKNKNEDAGTSLYFKVKASKEFEVNNGILTSISIFFLVNITPNLRIWKAMHMCSSARWKVLFSDNFMKSFKKLKSFRMKMSVMNLLLMLSTGWRPKKRNVYTICKSSSMISMQFEVDGLYIVCTTDIVKDLRYMQVLKFWDILPDLCDIQKLVDQLDCIFKRYTDGFINLCRKKCLEGGVEIPGSWPLSLDVSRFKDLSITHIPSDLVGDSSENRSYVENSKVRDSLLLKKFYSLSFGAVNLLLSGREDRELDLPFEVTDQEMEIILYNRSTFVLGRSGTGKTTVLAMKLYQKEQQHHYMAEEGFHGVGSHSFWHDSPNNKVSEATNVTVLRQLFVTVSSKLCFAVKRHVLHLKSLACGGSHSGQCSLINMDEFDDEEAQLRGIPDSFRDISSKCYPLFITFHKFLMMLDGSLSDSYFERFLGITKLPHGRVQSSRSVALQAFLRTKEVNYERFSSSYWPHFNTELTKKLDASRVFTEIISHIKGGLGAMGAGDGKLSRDSYVQMSEGRASSLSKQKREIVYDIFQIYEKMKMMNGEFDIADFVNDIHHRLKREKFEGDKIDFIYIDEVQDLTMSQIALFKHVCSNVEEGFVFSGDTAQTIARGIDFKFQDIRHLFYEKFLLESRRKMHHEQKYNGQISEIFHLTQNFRSHDGILKLLQSIIELLYRFFPFSIDVLKPEMSLIYGEAPVLLYSGENENVFVKFFGNSETVAGTIVGFGAEQVILVRDASARKEISKSIGKRALVLTILECKGLEFQDVVLYNFFGSSPLKNQWRVIYDFMKEQDLLDSTLPKRFPSFNDAKHNMLCSELKQLYVAVSRTRQRLWIYENVEELSNPMFDYWIKKCLVQVRQLDDSVAQVMQVESTPEQWKSCGIKLYHERNYKMARMCFDRSGDAVWERRSKAAELKVKADHMRTSNPEVANAILREAALIFEDIGQSVSAASCFYDLGEYEQAGNIYLNKCDEPELERAGECFFLAGCYALAADVYSRGNFFSECLTSCLQGKLFEIGLEYIKYWKQQATEEYALARQGNGADKIELEFLESCAFHYYKGNDDRSKMQMVKDEMLSARKFLDPLISSSTTKYLWEEKLTDNLKKAAEKKYKKELSIDSLVYFWNNWKEKIVYLIEYLRYIEIADSNEYRNYRDFFLNYLGVWRHFHGDLNLVYLSLISDVDWVRSVDKSSFRSNGELVSIDVHQLVLDAQSYWSSEMLSLGIRVLDKLEALYNFLIDNSDSMFCQIWSLIRIYETAIYLLESKILKRSYRDAETLHRFVKLSTENVVSYIFPLDWRLSSRESIISLRRSDACKNLLKQVMVEYISSTHKLSSGTIGCLAMIILGTGKLNNELYEKVLKNLDCSTPWKAFIENLCGNNGSEFPLGYASGNTSEQPRDAQVVEYSVACYTGGEQRKLDFSEGSMTSILGYTSQEPGDVSLLWMFHDALFGTYHANWSSCYSMTPDCFLYLVERLLIWVCCCQGYVITTRSCFIEWLLYLEEYTKLASCMVADVGISFEDILQFLTDVVREFLFDKVTMTKWIKMSTRNWKKYYKLLIRRLVTALCLLYLNFGRCFDVLLDLLRRNYVTEQLPKDFCNALRSIMSLQNSLSRNVNVLAKAFKNIGNPLVIASFGIDCSRFFCSDAIFKDMKANLRIVDILRNLFSEQCMVQSSRRQTGAIENTRCWNRRILPMDFDRLWEIFEGLELVKERDHRSFFSDASTMKLDVENIICLLTAAWSARFPESEDREEHILSGEVLSLIDGLMQLYAALDGSEQELGNKMLTVAELSRRLQLRRQRMEPIFFWPEKMEPALIKLFLEHNTKLAGKA